MYRVLGLFRLPHPNNGESNGQENGMGPKYFMGSSKVNDCFEPHNPNMRPSYHLGYSCDSCGPRFLTHFYV